MADADFSQIEYRTLVAMANEPMLLELFKDPDNDYHTIMASLMYSVPYALVTPDMRKAAKSFNFGIPYGMGFRSLSKLLHDGVATPETIEDAKEKYALYFKDQPMVKRFFDEVKEYAKLYKKTKTKFNRVREYNFNDKEGNYSQKYESIALRQAGNAVIQGCLSGDTLIQTKEYGIVKIEDVVDKHLLVWDGDKWSNGDILYSGKKRKCVITFTNGQKFVCSPIHKFLVRSAKGNERFVECKDLHTVDNSKNPHRIVITHKYELSDWKYSSEWAHKYKSGSHNANNVFLDNIEDSFKAGVVLGRLASDGSILDREVGGSCVLQYIAEHEISIAPILKEYMKNLKYTYTENAVREDRNEALNRLYVYSKSLVKEISELDIKHQIDSRIFQDTEMLRGFLRGVFDGDGGISGKTINLIFGTQADFEPICRQIQKALLFFGIRSRYYKYDYRSKITIKTNDNQKFLDIIGFINGDKQKSGRELECVRDEHIFGQILIPQSVEITDEYIDMYDVCNTDGGYYVADGIITHNTAADIFKIGVARTFMYIRQNGLLGLFLITNMIHDEQLTEINCEKLNVKKVLSALIDRMQMKLNGFPPLYVGAGIGMSWADAKGKMAEIHPHLADRYAKECENESVWLKEPTHPEEVLKYFNDRVYEFRKETVTNYVLDEKNWNNVIHPVIGNLLGLQFDCGVQKEFDEKYNGDSKEEKAEREKHLADIPVEQLKRFIENNNLNVDPNLFLSTAVSVDEEEDISYDEEDGDVLDLDLTTESLTSEFALIDESEELYGVDIRDIIREFGLVVSRDQRICGIDVTIMSYKRKDEIAEYLDSHTCEPDDDGAMQVAFLKENNILLKTGVWVKGIQGSRMSAILRIKSVYA